MVIHQWEKTKCWKISIYMALRSFLQPPTSIHETIDLIIIIISLLLFSLWLKPLTWMLHSSSIRFIIRNCAERKLTVMFGISVIFHQVFQFSNLFGKGSWKIYYHNSLILCVAAFSAALNISGHQGIFMISIRPLSKAWNTVNLRVVSSLFHCTKTQVLNSP